MLISYPKAQPDKCLILFSQQSKRYSAETLTVETLQGSLFLLNALSVLIINHLWICYENERKWTFNDEGVWRRCRLRCAELVVMSLHSFLFTIKCSSRMKWTLLETWVFLMFVSSNSAKLDGIYYCASNHSMYAIQAETLVPPSWPAGLSSSCHMPPAGGDLAGPVQSACTLAAPMKCSRSRRRCSPAAWRRVVKNLPCNNKKL